MANPHGNTRSCDPQEQDEISLFLRQILLRSSPSSSSSTPQFDSSSTTPILPKYQTFPGAGSGSESRSTGVNWALEGTEHDCESEGAGEIMAAEEAAARPIMPPRSSSKRSRAAEVHNLSEKRRRSKINEKMKALQNLIPNSNKTDKASMLDEAIEYLKHLQLQVQMLTLRNGLSHYPICCFPNARINTFVQPLNGTISMDQRTPLPSETIPATFQSSSQDILLQGLPRFDQPVQEDRSSEGKAGTALWPYDSMVKEELESESTDMAWPEHLLSDFENTPSSHLS